MTNFKFTYKCEDDKVTLYTNERTLRGIINDNLDGHYLYIPGPINDFLFKKLGVDKVKFSERVLGYKVGNGMWPEMNSRKDVIKVIDKLMVYSKVHDEY